MPRRNRNRQNNDWNWSKIFWLFVLGFFVFGRSPEFLSILFFLGIAYFVYRWFIRNTEQAQYQSARTQLRSESQGATVDPSEIVRIHENAARAMHRAGRNIKESPLRLNDIGLLVYEGSTQPQIYRTAEIASNATHIRPFMVLDNPDMHSTGQGIIRFNVMDDEGKLRFTNRSRYTVKPGQNFITPPTWLPLQDQDVSGKWTMQVNIGEATVFAIHEFSWLKVGGELRAQFTGDGEIDEIAYNYEPGESLSLDELLGQQGEQAPLVMESRQ